jgi:hypothetical protein
MYVEDLAIKIPLLIVSLIFLVGFFLCIKGCSFDFQPPKKINNCCEVKCCINIKEVSHE